VRRAQQRVFAACQPIKPGEGPGAQIRNASNALQITYDEAWRAWHGRASLDLAEKIEEHWPEFEARHMARSADAVVERLERLDQSLAQLADIISDLARREAHSRGDASPRSRMARASA
jgi:hypothetical protein